MLTRLKCYYRVLLISLNNTFQLVLRKFHLAAVNLWCLILIGTLSGFVSFVNPFSHLSGSFSGNF